MQLQRRAASADGQHMPSLRTMSRRAASSLFSLRLRRSRAACALAAAIALNAAGAQAAAAYQNPFSGTQPYVGRTDMGVDVCMSAGDPIRAIGNGVVAGVIRNWYQKQPYIWYELTDGPQAGHYVYVAEQIGN